MDTFDAAWEVLEEQGSCDARGSAEYRRVRAEWERTGEMLAALTFILKLANQVPPPKTIAQDRSGSTIDKPAG